jgi:hypothetical protein
MCCPDSPFRPHALWYSSFRRVYAPVAQLDRASASGAEGYRFEPYRAYQSNQQFRSNIRPELLTDSGSIAKSPELPPRVRRPQTTRRPGRGDPRRAPGRRWTPTAASPRDRIDSCGSSPAGPGSRSRYPTPTPARAAHGRPLTRSAAAAGRSERAARWRLARSSQVRSASIAGTHPRAGAAPTRWPRLRLFGHAHPEPSEEAPRKMGAGRSRGRRRRPPLVEGPLLIALEAHDPVDDPLRHRQYVDRSSLTRLYRSRPRVTWSGLARRLYSEPAHSDVEASRATIEACRG